MHVYSVAQPCSKQLVFPADSADSKQLSVGKFLDVLYSLLTIYYFFVLFGVTSRNLNIQM